MGLGSKVLQFLCYKCRPSRCGHWLPPNPRVLDHSAASKVGAYPCPAIHHTHTDG
jgi:hypothetical protein